jgi:hypothetical protein
MRERTEAIVREWLQTIPVRGSVPDESVTRLGRFLQGFQLDLAADEEPCVALYDWAVAQRSVSQLADAVVALLKRWLDGQWKPSQRERAHYNLLQLCVEIGDRRRLGDPIWQLYQQRVVDGEYNAFRAISLSDVLLKAMIRNPIEGSQPPGLWRNFLNGTPDNYLNGAPLDGFLGMLYLPKNGLPQSRVETLAGCLQILHRIDDESFFLSALAAMRRVEPGQASAEILERAGLDICDEYVTIVKGERRSQVIESTLRQTNQMGNWQMKEDLGSQWAEVCHKLESMLRQDAMGAKVRTKTQMEGLFSHLINSHFYSPDHANPYRILAFHARALADLRDPEALKRQDRAA